MNGCMIRSSIAICATALLIAITLPSSAYAQDNSCAVFDEVLAAPIDAVGSQSATDIQMESGAGNGREYIVCGEGESENSPNGDAIDGGDPPSDDEPASAGAPCEGDNGSFGFADNEKDASSDVVEATDLHLQIESTDAALLNADSEDSCGETAIDLADGLYYLISYNNSALRLGVANSDSSNGAAVQAEGCSGSASQSFRLTRLADGTYLVSSFNSDKVLAVSGFDAVSGASVLQWSDNGTANMRWKIVKVGDAYLLRSVDSDLVLDLAADIPAPGTQAVVWNYTGSPKQLFSILKDTAHYESVGKTVVEGLYVISSAVDGDQNLNVWWGYSENGTNISLYADKGTIEQRFLVTYESDGYYSIMALCSFKMLAVAGFGTQNGANVVQWSDNGTANMRWLILPSNTASSQYLLVSKDSGLCLDFAALVASSMANVVVWEQTGSQKQRFTFSETEPLRGAGANYIITPASNDYYRLDVSGASLSNGGDLILWCANGGLSQKFSIAGSGTGYIITALHSGKVLAIGGDTASGQPPVVQWADNATENMRWNIGVSRAGGYFLSSVKNGQTVYLTLSDLMQCASLRSQTVYTGSSLQLFRIIETPLIDDGYYTLRMGSDSGYLVALSSYSTSPGVGAVLQHVTNSITQKYWVVNCGDDVIKLIARTSGKVLCVPYGSSFNGRVIQWEDNGTDNMRWKVVLGTSGTVQLRNLESGFCLDFGSDTPYPSCPMVIWEETGSFKQSFRFVITADAFYSNGLGSVLGITREDIVAELETHLYDSYYLGTRYTEGGFWNSFWPNGSPREDGYVGFNCAGFVARVFWEAGANIGLIDPYASEEAKSSSASAWLRFARAYGLTVYGYRSINELLSDGRAEKGDVIFFDPWNWGLPAADTHLTIFWGETGSHNVIWHEPGDGNQIGSVALNYPKYAYLLKV